MIYNNFEKRMLEINDECSGFYDLHEIIKEWGGDEITIYGFFENMGRVYYELDQDKSLSLFLSCVSF